MDNQVRLALEDFTHRFCAAWYQQTQGWPVSETLQGIPSPCIINATSQDVRWQPKPFTLDDGLNGVQRAMDMVLQPSAHQFYTTQFAGDMPASLQQLSLTLLQAWSEEDFQRVQENLIGHLVMQKRLKLPPTLFLATTPSDVEIVSLCNLTGEVILEKIGTRNRTPLASSLAAFLQQLEPQVI